jgi:uncharacterized membrane protein YfcA
MPVLEGAAGPNIVIEFPNSATFAAVFADPRFFLALGIATTCGLVRGFSGFGSALIYMPLMAAVYDPLTAAVTLLLVDFISSTPFAIPEVRRCTWREVLPISVAMAVTVPLGTYLLIVLDPLVLRWAIALLVLSLVSMLMSGWRYTGPSTLPITTAVGMFAGIGAGAAQIAGPAVILYWLSRGNNATTLRANLMVFFVFCGVILIAVYAAQGLFNARLIALALLFTPCYIAGVAIGSRSFRSASDRLYRNVAYAICLLAAILSLPILDPILR